MLTILGNILLSMTLNKMSKSLAANLTNPHVVYLLGGPYDLIHVNRFVWNKWAAIGYQIPAADRDVWARWRHGTHSCYINDVTSYTRYTCYDWSARSDSRIFPGADFP